MSKKNRSENSKRISGAHNDHVKQRKARRNGALEREKSVPKRKDHGRVFW
ncbi:MAG: hypothetical protein V1856_02680 [Candidatus Liptonbacteria bacterium]